MSFFGGGLASKNVSTQVSTAPCERAEAAKGATGADLALSLAQLGQAREPPGSRAGI